jgi:hypothetical protein
VSFCTLPVYSENMTIKTIRDALTTAASTRPTSDLCPALLEIDSKLNRDEAEQLTRAILIDVLCERHPEAEAAFTVWAEDDSAMKTAAQVVVGAAMAAVQ